MRFHFPKHKKQITYSSQRADSPTKTPAFAPFPDISCPAMSCLHGIGVLLKSALSTSQLTKPHKGAYLIN